MSDLPAETKTAHVPSVKGINILSSLCGLILGDIKNQRILRERTLLDFCKAAVWTISDGPEKLPESFHTLADRISTYWLYETDSETDEERKYSYIRLYQTVCVLRVYLEERELEEKAFSAVERYYASAEIMERIGREPGITNRRLTEICAFPPDELLRRTGLLRQDGFLSVRRSGADQYYFLTNAGESLRRFLDGHCQRQFLQKHWSHDRIEVLIFLLQQVNKPNFSFDFLQVVKAVGSLSEKAVEILAKKYAHPMYFYFNNHSAWNTVGREDILLKQDHASPVLKESRNWVTPNMVVHQIHNYSLGHSAALLPIRNPADKNASLFFVNRSNIYE